MPTVNYTLGQPWIEPQDMVIDLGGIQGLTDLDNPANVSALLATGKASYYGQVVGQASLAASTPPALTAAAQTFAGAGPGVAELNLLPDAQSYLQSVFAQDYTQYGFNPTEANVNFNGQMTVDNLSQFENFVNAAEAFGISNVAPVFAPNYLPTQPVGNFSDPAYDLLRTAALYGGGLAIDAPPSYYLGGQSQTAAYDAFIAAEIQWANSKGLRSSVIVSPADSGAGFLAATQTFVADLTERGAIPTQWVVENYATGTGSYPNPIGSDTQPNTISSVALWIAQNAPVTSYTFAGGTWTGDQTLNPDGSLVQSVNRAGIITHANLGQNLTIGSGTDSLVLTLSGDSWQGAPLATIAIDGQQVGGTISVAAVNGYNQAQTVTILGNLSQGDHTASISFLNDAYGGVGEDRNLYVTASSFDGTALPGGTLTLMTTGTQSLPFYVVRTQTNVVPVTIGSGPNNLALSISEDAWQGDAQFTVTVDGQQIGGIQTATAYHGAGQSQTFNVLGSFAAGTHTVAVDFLNDAYGGPGMDRNLYVDSAAIGGIAVARSTLYIPSTGAENFTFQQAPATSTLGPTTIGSGSDTIALSIAEDAWQGDAQFTVSVDGTQVGAVQTATAYQSAGQTQTFNVLGNFTGGNHTVSVNFLNDSYAAPGQDRNLYVDAAAFNGATISGTLTLLGSGPQSLPFYVDRPPAAVSAVTIGNGPDTLALSMAEDAWEGDAQFTVTVDGTQIGGIQTATAYHSAGQSQTFNVLGSFTAGAHTVSVTFLNDAYGGPGMDRNLYVNGATIDGLAVPASTLYIPSTGAKSFTFQEVPTAASLTPVTIGAGSDDLALSIAEDAWQADAQFTVSVDGTQVGGIQTAAAYQSAGQVQTFNLLGNFTGGTHTVSVNFLNDAYGGPGMDRNLYVDAASFNGVAVPGSLALFGPGAQSLPFYVARPLASSPTITIGSGPDTLALSMAEDAWQGDAQFTVTVDGTQIGGIQTTTAYHSTGQSQTFNVLGSFAASAVHTVSVAFLNDAYGGPGMDRNLYVAGATIDGAAVAGSTLSIPSTGAQSFTVPITSISPLTIGAGSDTLALSMAEDAWQGDAQFTVTVDGQQIGGVQTTAAYHSAGKTQTFNVLGNFGGGNHTVSVAFLNDAYGGPGMDRNLYLAGASINGTAVPGSTLYLPSNGAQSFTFEEPRTTLPPVTIGSGPDTLAIAMSEDAWQGDAQFTVTVDGTQIGGVQTTAAFHSVGQSQTFDVLGSFSPGSHAVSVDFLNDAYGGPGMDRNLYLTSATLDGAAQPGGSLALYGGGTQSFTATTATTYNEGAAGGSVTTLGNDTVNITSGNVTIHANGPSATVSGGSGAMTFIANAGNDAVNAASGAATVTGGAGSLTFTAGSGNATLNASSGRLVVDLTNGQAGGVITVNGFVANQDIVHLSGYTGSGVASQTVTAGSTHILLTDGTQVALNGYAANSTRPVFG